MTHQHSLPSENWAFDPAYRTLAAFPICAFTLTIFTDIAYWRTANLLWLHFSEWLLLAGLVLGILAAVFLVVAYLVSKYPPIWPHAIGGVAVLVLAALNSFIHTADGWTAVLPWGLTISVVTVLVMIVTGWLGSRSVLHV
jgi:uncharacterized membrane protein